jgi:alkanesulfonate monooxygenase SsuD/methylene tetrahydromethanopterin reductase-like flavin-dependent oxidoreductase (luciferase family)
MLGSSPQSAIWAAEVGLPYAFADFINPAGAEIAALYRQRFVPSANLQASRTAVGVSVICAPDDEQAQRLAASGRMTWTLLRRGQPLSRVPSPDEALAFLAREGEPLNGGIPGRRAIIGSPSTVRFGLESVAAEYGADEVIVVTITYDHEARRQSYELIAEAMDLQPRELAASPA